MKTLLSEEEKHAFVEIIFTMTKDDLKREYSVEDIKARPLAGVNKENIVDYIPSYVKNGYVSLNESTQKIRITKKGIRLFEQLRGRDERSADRTRYVIGMNMS